MMSRFLKFIALGLASLAAIAVLLVVVASLIPNDTYRAWLTKAVSSATGRDLAVDGIFEIEIGSRLELRADGVRFANAEWGTEPSMVTIRRVDAALSIPALLEGVVDVTLEVDTPNVFLETDAAGRGNWQMGAAAKPSPAEPSAPNWRALAPQLRVTGGQLRFLHGGNGRLEQFDLGGFQFGAPDARLTAALDGRYQDERVTLSADLGSMEDITAGNATDTRLDAALGDNVLAVTGSWSWAEDVAAPTADLFLIFTAPFKVCGAAVARERRDSIRIAARVQRADL